MTNSNASGCVFFERSLHSVNNLTVASAKEAGGWRVPCASVTTGCFPLAVGDGNGAIWRYERRVERPFAAGEAKLRSHIELALLPEARSLAACIQRLEEQKTSGTYSQRALLSVLARKADVGDEQIRPLLRRTIHCFRHP